MGEVIVTWPSVSAEGCAWVAGVVPDAVAWLRVVSAIWAGAIRTVGSCRIAFYQIRQLLNLSGLIWSLQRLLRPR